MQFELHSLFGCQKQWNLTDTVALKKKTKPKKTPENPHQTKKTHKPTTKNPKPPNKKKKPKPTQRKKYWPDRKERIPPTPSNKMFPLQSSKLWPPQYGRLFSPKLEKPVSSLWCYYWITWLPPNRHFIVQFSGVLA